MFTIMVRSWPGSSTGVGARCAMLAVTLHRIILAQRVTFPIFGHEEAPQIRMPRESHSKEVENFALKVIRPRPDRRNRFDSRAGTIQANLQPDALLFGNRKQVIDDFKPGLSRIPVHARTDGKEVESALRIVPQQRASLADVLPVDVDRHLVAIELCVLHCGGVPSQQPCDCWMAL